MSALAPTLLPDPEDDPGPGLSVVRGPAVLRPAAPEPLMPRDASAEVLTDVSGWSDDRLVAEVTAAERQARIHAARAGRLAVEFVRRHPEAGEERFEDDLSRAALDELSVATGLARGSFAYRLRAAMALESRFPRLRDASEAGLVPAPAIRTVLDLTVGLTDEDCRRVETGLLYRLGAPTHDLTAMTLTGLLALDDEDAMTLSSRATTAAVGRWTRDQVSRIDRQARARRARAVQADRRVFFEPGPDGMGLLGARVPQAIGWACWEHVDDLARALPSGPDDGRSMDMRRADVLCALVLGTGLAPLTAAGMPVAGRQGTEPGGAVSSGSCRIAGSAAESSGPPDHPADLCIPASPGLPGRLPALTPLNLNVLLDHTRCAPDAGCVADVGRLGPVTAQTVADLLTLTVQTGGTVRGAHVVDQPCPGPDEHAVSGPGPYQPGEPLRRFVQARQRRCAWPGCERPARACELDHTIPHRLGGPTCECNLAPVCVYHHQVKHHPGPGGRPPWRLVNHGRGHLTWTTPTGRRIDVWPEQPDNPDPPQPPHDHDPPPY